MRKVVISSTVLNRIEDLKDYLVNDLKLSEKTAMRRVDRMGKFLKSFGAEVNYPLCRFNEWRIMGYRCAVCEKDWVFAYEIFEDGIIVRDMSHTSLLTE